MNFISNFKNASSFENITQYLNKFNAINVLSQEEEEEEEEGSGLSTKLFLAQLFFFKTLGTDRLT